MEPLPLPPPEGGEEEYHKNKYYVAQTGFCEFRLAKRGQFCGLAKFYPAGICAFCVSAGDIKKS